MNAYSDAVRNALKNDPDVITIGEVASDAYALKAASTGKTRLYGYIGETQTLEVPLATGHLKLSVENGPEIDDYCDFAARANPKRGFLIVSKVLGRHLPARPDAMRSTMADLAQSLPADLPQPIVFLGMAETATALGQGVFAAYQALHPSSSSIYLQTARQTVHDAMTIARFEEGHSHATSHLVQVCDANLADIVKSARSLVIIDDESSTGNTFVSAAEGILPAMPMLERIETCCITDWSGGAYLARMPRSSQRHSILSGSMEWTAGSTMAPPKLAAGSNGSGTAPAGGMRSRSGLRRPEASSRPPVNCHPGERILVLGDGEHSYEALLIAEEIETQGGLAAVQSITRTPAILGDAMATVSQFTDAYGSGAPCFLYNILAHEPGRILVASEILDRQIDEGRKAVLELGADIPVEMILCSYQDETR
ncbi:phosphoribosyltransferase domain-containing protein [Novosphingobium profundi]|uniref:phosphoribosyltransferase domain-containing protein n=1 Tax=Novosphingobium profundi TaxID=1774954 RepID=UPI001BDB12E2|nr:phosphoribosyltransferase domain-containing protein [Novosphingobium profundi]MBT0671474.1 phosphoribosyltransferase domain-containing protein [Novosphingobium profundi]